MSFLLLAHFWVPRKSFAYDLDDVAVRVAQENIELNSGMENIQVAPGDLLKGVGN